MHTMARARFLLAGVLLSCASAPASERQAIPAEFVHERIFVTPSIDGRALRFFTDTGGGWNAMSRRVAAEIGLDVRRESAGEKRHELVEFPVMDEGATIPLPPAFFMDGRLMLADDGELSGADGFLGGRWFGGRVWEIDYPKQRMFMLEGHVDRPYDPRRVELGFQTNSAGQRTMHFPSMDVEIDGEVLPMLLDTGATATTTASSARVFGVAKGDQLGTSFIEHEVFERWRHRHPEWRVLEAADQKNDQRRMIEVPLVRVAGYDVGPVWFAEQPPGAFQTYMASMMDRPTWGALGGSALRYFRVVIDYPNSAAYFYRD